MDIRFIDLKAQYESIKTSIDARIHQVLDHGQYIMGPEVLELEDKLAAFVGVKHCVSASSGTDTLQIAMMALGIGQGDEVITTPFTFVATAEMIVAVGATPVFVDTDPLTHTIDPRKIEEAITKKTKAIMPVSLYGQCADMDAINSIALKYGLTVIEDAAQSFGATYRGKKSCALSTIGSTSFFPSKPLGCYGDGGALFTNDDNLAKSMKEIRIHGQDRRYHHARIGVNGRLDTIQAAILLAKLEQFNWEIEQRQKNADNYTSLISQICPSVVTPFIADFNTSVYAQYTIIIENRDAVAAKLNSDNVPTAIHYPIPLNKQPAYRDISKGGETPISDRIAQKVLSLPMGPYLQEEEQVYIVNCLKNALQ